MTLLESTREIEPIAVTETEPTPRAPNKSVRESTRRVTATAVIALLVIVAGWAAFELFEGPVAQIWNHTRQHQLGSELAQNRPHTGRGSAIAVMQVPRLGINLVVAEGDSPQQLRGGPGHRIGTPLPGDIGNSVVLGHRTGWGDVLRNLTALHPGDLIVVQTKPASGPRNGVFKVISVRRATADDLAPFRGSTDRRLTIVSGTGGQFSDGRLVVVAVSGSVGKVLSAAHPVPAPASSGSRLWNAEMLLALLGFAGALLIGVTIRRRYRPAIVAVAVVPLVTLGLLGLFLNLDLFLPPLR